MQSTGPRGRLHTQMCMEPRLMHLSLCSQMLIHSFIYSPNSDQELGTRVMGMEGALFIPRECVVCWEIVGWGGKVLGGDTWP